VRRWRAKVAQLTMRQVSFLFHMAFLLWGVRIGLVYSCSQCSQFGHGILWKQICGPIELCLWIVQVADELVSESTNPDSPRISPDQDEKNIRRRVYDALNVLMALGIILKDKKDIQWKGLPSSASLDDDQELHGEGMRVRDRKERIERIEKKAAYLHDLQAQMTGLENLVSRNERLYHGTNSVPAGGVTLPFILVQTQPQATVEVEISEDMQVVHFDFNSTPFELHDDAYVLKALSLQEHQGAKSTEVMGRRGFDDGLGCKFEEDSSPLSSVFQHSSFPPRTSPYYPVSMPSVAKGSLGMLQVSSSRVKQENLS
jgi:transcription factor Dp-1